MTMTMAINCPNCKALFRLGEEMSGKRVKCQKCAHIFVVVNPDAAAPDGAPTAETPKAKPVPQMEIDDEATDEATGVTASKPNAKTPPKAKNDDPDEDDDEPRSRNKTSKPPQMKNGRTDDDDDDDDRPTRGRSNRGRGPRRDRAPASSGSGSTVWIVLLVVLGVGLIACVPCAGIMFWGMVAVPVNQPGPFVFNDRKDMPADDMMPIQDNFDKKGMAVIDKGPPNPVKDAPPPPPPPPPQKGAISVTFNASGSFSAANSLAITDPSFKFDFGGPKRCKLYVVQFNVGDEYQIDMMQTGKNLRMDPYLIVKDDTGVIVTQDDDGGGNLNSRIIFRPNRSGVYQIYATSLIGIDTGSYLLTVRRIRTFPVNKGDPPFKK